jgi:hypothetical protein
MMRRLYRGDSGATLFLGLVAAGRGASAASASTCRWMAVAAIGGYAQPTPFTFPLPLFLSPLSPSSANLSLLHLCSSSQIRLHSVQIRASQGQIWVVVVLSSRRPVEDQRAGGG